MRNMATIGKTPECWKHVSPDDWQDWHWQLKSSVVGITALQEWLKCQSVEIEADQLGIVAKRYRFRAAPYYLSLADWTNPADPIRLQCLPDSQELEEVEPYSIDPFGEQHGSEIPGVVHRFPDRVLLVATTECAVACRHCTRKNTLAGLGGCVQGGAFNHAIDYLRAHPEVREVLISGGDPLLLETDVLDRLLNGVLAVPHVEVVRIGTRVPVVLPMRVDDELVTMLAQHQPLWVNTQFNHPNELTTQATDACKRLVNVGIPVSNQTVLLRGINDSVEVMYALCTGLQRNRIRPYYVFQCDPVAGIPHFRTSVDTGSRLESELREMMGGLCLPRFVADIPGAPGKTPL